MLVCVGLGAPVIVGKRVNRGFDVGFELETACRVTLGHVKTGEF